MSLTIEQIKSIVENSCLKADHVFEQDPICLEISGQYGNKTFSTLGNFSVILAPPKVGKTTAGGVLTVTLLTGKQNSNFIGSLVEEKKIVAYIDTEQARPEGVKVIQSICYQITGNKNEHPENFIYLSLRGQNKEVISSVIEYIVYNTPNIGFIIIDGIRDLVTSINDEREAAYIVEKLMRWTQEANIHILTILHQNKGDANARGHLGTELINKSETVASLSKGDYNGTRTTIVEIKHGRHTDFESFAFSVDSNGVVLDSEIKQSYDNKNPTVEQLTHFQLEAITKYSFSNTQYLPYGKLWPEIKKALLEIEVKYGDNKCKSVLTKLQKDGYIGIDNNHNHYFSNMPV